MIIAELVFKIIFCHLIGDYVLQGDFIAQSKGKNIYHLIVHCFLYAIPFYLVFGFDWKLFVIIGTHIIIDALKARWNRINYLTDQCLHYGIAFVVYVLMTLW